MFKNVQVWRHLIDSRMDLGDTKIWTVLQFLEFMVKLNFRDSLPYVF